MQSHLSEVNSESPAAPFCRVSDTVVSCRAQTYYSNSESCGVNLWPPVATICRGSEAGLCGFSRQMCSNAKV